MLVISVFYPAPENGSFDFSLLHRHPYSAGAAALERHGPAGGRVMKGSAGPDGSAPAYVVVTLLTFELAEAFGAAAAQHGGEIFGDIPNFTSAAPVVQFNERLV